MGGTGCKAPHHIRRHQYRQNGGESAETGSGPRGHKSDRYYKPAGDGHHVGQTERRATLQCNR